MSRTFIGGLLALFMAPSVGAQTPGVTLSGHVVGASQAAIVHATVSISNTTTGRTQHTETDDLGAYAFSNVPLGTYDVSVSADRFQTKTDRVTLAAGFARTLDVTLSPASNGLSLEDLGISKAEASGNPELQARLDRRTRMLQIHQRLGLITAAPMLASLITSGGAKTGRLSPTSSTGRDVHAVLGATTAGLYIATAYFAIRAPKVEGVEERGHIRLHKALAWVHGSGMVLTPILGAVAFNQERNGQQAHGIASMHGPVAVTTFGAYVGALVAVSIR